MKLDLNSIQDKAQWERAGIVLPKFDLKQVAENTKKAPTWIHFGAGNIFRAFPAAILQDVLDSGKYDKGVIVAEGFDYEIIDKAYRPYDDLSLLVLLKSDGSIEKKVVASVTESLKADPQFGEDWARLVEIFRSPSLEMVSFTITEKGYSVSPADLERGMAPQLIMGKVTRLLLERFQAGQLPITVQSMDNCSHNGDKVQQAVLSYAEAWVKADLAPAGFLDYLNDESKVTFPWSMIDKITPRPDAQVQKMLAEDGFEDNETIITSRNTYTAPFVNAEETEYLVIEDKYANGRPPLELGGVLYADRDTVDKVEKMKVCTCLNPFMPDAPQRIATDTSQKLSIRFGETIKAYQAKGLNMDDLVLIPLVLAGYARYLKGVDDQGQPFEPSPDPLLAELQAIVAPLEVKEGGQDMSCLKSLYSRADVFGLDLYAAGLGERIEAMAAELYAGPGAVRRTLHKYVSAR